MKKLFLDDIRDPKDCSRYMNSSLVSLYNDLGWEVVRSYEEFVKYIMENGIPNLISYDHDLADEHYFPLETSVEYQDRKREGNIDSFYESRFQEKTGYHCAKWLVEYCMDNKIKMTEFIVHSMNPSGADNIRLLLENYVKHEISNSRQSS